MAVIIEHVPTGERFVLIGAGYGAWSRSTSSRIVGMVNAPGKSGESHMLCVSNAQGEVVWVDAEEARVLEIDRRTPTEFLAAFNAIEPPTPAQAEGDAPEDAEGEDELPPADAA